MKYIIFLSVIICFGCDGMYLDENKNKSSDTLQALISSSYYNNLPVDSVMMDGSIYHAPKVVYLCDFKVKKPYSLIQWNDRTYGILFKRGFENWYKGGQLDFTYVIQYATHFKDSCEAKQDLQRYLDSRITYKIVK